MPKYIYKGQVVSEERIAAAAGNLNMSIEDYLREYNFEIIEDETPADQTITDPGKELGPAKETAPAGPATYEQAATETAGVLGLPSGELSSATLRTEADYDFGPNVWADLDDAEQRSILARDIITIKNPNEKFPLVDPSKVTPEYQLKIQETRLNNRTKENMTSAMERLELDAAGLNEYVDVEGKKYIKYTDLDSDATPLYNPETGEFYRYKKSPEEKSAEVTVVATGNQVIPENVLNFEEQALEQAETTPLEDLKSQRTRKYYELVSLAQDGVNADVNLMPGGLLDFVKTGVNALFDMSPDTDNYFDDVKMLEEAAAKGELPKNLKKVNASSPWAKKWNSTVDEFFLTNRAIQLNQDLTATESSFSSTLESFVNPAKEFLGIDRAIEPTRAEVVQTLYNEIQSAGLVADETFKNQIEENLERSVGEIAGGTVYAVSELGLEVALLTRTGKMANLPGAFRTFGNRMARYAAANIKSPIIRNAIVKSNKNIIVNALKAATTEGATFAAAGQTYGRILRPNEEISAKHDFLFGFGMGAAGSFGKSIFAMVPLTEYVAATPMFNAYAKLSKFNTFQKAQENFVGATAGTITMKLTELAMDSEEFISRMSDSEGNFRFDKLSTDLLGTAIGLGVVRGVKGATTLNDNGLYHGLRNDILSFRGRSVESNRARKNLNIGLEESGEALQQKLNEALVEANNLAAEGKLKEAAQIEKDIDVIEFQEALVEAQAILKAEKNSGLEASDGEVLLLKQFFQSGKSASSMPENLSRIFAKTSAARLAHALGIKPGTPFYEALGKQQAFHYSIQKVLTTNQSSIQPKYQATGATFRAPLDSPLARQKTYDYLLEVLEKDSILYELKQKQNKTESDLADIKRIEKELKDYEVGGEKYTEVVEMLEALAKEKLSADIEKQRAKGFEVIEANSAKEFQELRDKYSGKDGTDVTKRTAVNITTEDGRKIKIINMDRALEVRDFSAATHEVIHDAGLIAGIRDKEGNITDQGIVIIDGILNKLTPKQRELVDARMESSGQAYGRSKKEYYEEHLNHIGELINEGFIKYNEGLGSELLNFMSIIKSKIPGLTVTPETGKDIFKMLADVAKGKATPESIRQMADVKERASNTQMLELNDLLAKGEISVDEYSLRLDEIIGLKEEASMQREKAEEIAADVDISELKSAQELIEFIQSTPKGSSSYNAAVNKLKPQFVDIVLKAINFSKVEGNVLTKEDAKEWIDKNLLFEDALKKYKQVDAEGNKRTFTTFVNNFYGRRGADLYKTIDAKVSTSSIDTPEGTKDIADMTVEQSEGPSLPEARVKKIHPKRFLEDRERIQEFENDVSDYINRPDFSFEDLTLANMPNLGANALAKILDIRPEQIQRITKAAEGPQGFLNTGTLFEVNGKLLKDKVYYKKRAEAKAAGKEFIASSIKEREDYRAARFLIKAYRNGLFNILPQYNVAPQLGKASEDPGSKAYIEGYKENVRGTSLKLPNKMLQAFYEKASEKDVMPEEFDPMMKGWTEESGRVIKNSYERWASGMRSGGITSQAEILRLKEMTAEQVIETLKLPDREVGVEKDYMQFVLGQVVVLGKLMTLSEIRRQLEINPEQPTAASAGKRREQFSTTFEKYFSESFIETTGYAQLRTAFYNKNGQLKAKPDAATIKRFFKGNVRKFNKAIEIYTKQGEKGLKEYTDKLRQDDNEGYVGSLIQYYFESKAWSQGVFATQANKNRGVIYEEFVKKILKNIPEVEVKLLGGFSNKGAGDMVLTFNLPNGKKSFNIELKLNDRAQLGSYSESANSPHYKEAEWQSHPAVLEMTNKLSSPEFLESKKDFEDKAMKIAEALDGEAIVKNGVLYVDSKVHGVLVSEGWLSVMQQKVYTDGSAVSLFQKIKEVDLIDFNEKGTFSANKDLAIESKNKIEYIGNQLKEIGDVSLTGRYVKGDYNKSGLASMNYRVFLNLEKPLIASNFSITNPKTFKEFIKSNREGYSTTVLPDAKGIELRASEYIFAKNSSIPVEKKVSKSEAIVRGAEVDKQNKLAYTFGKISPENNDFLGLLYDTLPSGKAGVDAQQFYKEAFVDPYNRAANKLDSDKLTFAANYRNAKKQNKISDVSLQETIEGTYFRTQDAVRVYIWDKQGYKIPELSAKEQGRLLNHVKSNPALSNFANQLVVANGKIGWGKPEENWIAGGIKSDIAKTLKGINRAVRLEKWQENIDAFFSQDNLHKMEAAYGTRWVIAMKNSLMRQQTGENRYYKMDSQVGRFADQLSGAVLNTLNFNNKSALLQLTSATNYINWTDNSPLMAAKAFANQPQYWKDVSTLMMTDFLRERRGGLTMELNEADIAELAKKGGFRGLTAKLLKVGMAPTVIADNIAIAGGGATFYRNRINRYVREGMERSAAERQALEDWRETSETSQQSSRPDKISMNQAGPLGRIVLAYTNTPQQYMRQMQKALRDIKNRRGDYKTNVSKVIYYGFMQNLLFTSLQAGVNGLLFDDPEVEIPDVLSDKQFEEYLRSLPPENRRAAIDEHKKLLKEKNKLEAEEKKKANKGLNTLNSMLDTSLKGLGLYGQVVATAKNAAFRTYLESLKDRPDYADQIPRDLLSISPGLGIKYSYLRKGIGTVYYNYDEIRERGLADPKNPIYAGVADITAGVTNAPVNRYLAITRQAEHALDDELALSTRILSGLGWSEYALGIPKEEYIPDDPETVIKFKEWKEQMLRKLQPEQRAQFFAFQKELEKRRKEKNK